MKDTTLAWLAALIDGEGSVMMSKRSGGNSEKQARPHYRYSVVIYNTNPALIDAIVEKTGISRVYTHKRPVKMNHRNHSYSWRMSADDIRKWGPALLPWLVIKREQMQLLLEALEIASLNTPRKGQTWVPQSTERRDEIVKSISELNRHGRFAGEEA